DLVVDHSKSRLHVLSPLCALIFLIDACQRNMAPENQSFSEVSQYDKALEDLLIIQNKLAPVISDCVNAGELLIGRSEYSLALKYINRGIILSDNLNDMYYISTLLFMRALVYIKLNNYSEAKEILNNIDPFSEFWIDRTLPYTRDELLDVIRGNE
ncbi:MAG: hypothetical protein OEV92_13905, partial [Nitrospinota bacterium]|nr:hypothetical protein [Nitrospinota bacterium]